MQLKVLLLGVFVLGVNYGVSCLDCPNAEDIAPCVCYIPPFYLVCENIQDVARLKTVAENMEGYPTHFAKLVISNSSLQYLPKELLEILKVKELHLENVTLHSLFREPPTSLDFFRIIRLNNVRILRGIVWEVFRQMRNLQVLAVNNLAVSVLGKDFSQNVPHTLQELQLWNTKTRKLEMGVFENFKNLKKLDISLGKLEEIHRGSFPVPFNIETIFIIDSRLKSIPDDLFTNMPNLKDIVLAGNQLSTIPESAFGGRYNQLDRFILRENPLKCDCALRWIVMHKPTFFDGTCAAPKIMHGRKLNKLYWENFYC